MERWTVYCCVCGNIPAAQTDAYAVGLVRDPYIQQLSVILDNGRVLHGCRKSDTARNVFEKDGSCYAPLFNESRVRLSFHNPNRCVFVHTACHEFVAEEFGVELNLSHLPVVKNRLVVNYGDIKKYHNYKTRAFFQFTDMQADGNMWMTENPLASGTRNWLRLTSILRQFNLPTR